MNVRTALISSALLVAVLGWACEQGPTSPSGLGTPGGIAAGGVSLDAAGGVISGVKPECGNNPNLPPCPPPDPDPETQKFNITIASAQIPVPTPQEFSRPGSLDPGILDVDFMLDLGFFNGPAGCALGTKTGQFTISKGDAGGPHVHIAFQFMHTEEAGGVESKHSLEMDGEPVDPAWDPTTTRTATESPAGNGSWTITAKGRNHQNGCKGEGGELDFEITIVPV